MKKVSGKKSNKKWWWIGGGAAVVLLLLSSKKSAATPGTKTISATDAKSLVNSGVTSIANEFSKLPVETQNALIKAGYNPNVDLRTLDPITRLRYYNVIYSGAAAALDAASTPILSPVLTSAQNSFYTENVLGYDQINLGSKLFTIFHRS